jgi:DNA-binding MarR family transcriptional regulator
MTGMPSSPTAEIDDGASSQSDEAALAADAAEVWRLLRATMLDLKRAGRPPAETRAAIESGLLSKRHMPTLLAVAEAGPISVSELAARLGAQLTTTSTVVGELSRAGLVERSEDENDRRRTIVRVHSNYRDDLKAWLEAATAPIRNTLTRLSPSARKCFMEGWRVLHEESAKAAGDGEEPEYCQAGGG